MKKLFIILALGAIFCAACNEDDKTEPIEMKTPGEIALSGFEPSAVACEGGAVEVTITSNADWRLVGRQTWCRPSTEAGKSGDKVVFTIDPNDEDQNRTIIYKFFCGNKTVSFPVTQEPGRIFTVGSDRNIPMTVKGGVFYVRTLGNSEVSHVIQPDATAWITTVQTRSISRSLPFNVGANDTYAARTGHVVVTGAGVDCEITVQQVQQDGILTDKILYEADPVGDQLTINLQANIAYVVEIPAKTPWVRQKAQADVVSVASALPGMTEYTLLLEVDPTRFTREADITLKGVGCDFSMTFKVRQQGSAEAVVADIPDNSLRNWLLSNSYVLLLEGITCQLLDKGYDATTLDFGSKSVKSTEGLGNFPNLTSVTCRNNPLEKIVLGDSQITSFNGGGYSSNGNLSVIVSGTNLETLKMDAWYYAMKSLDISDCPALKTLDVSYCMQLSTIYLKTGQATPTINKNQAGSCRIVYK